MKESEFHDTDQLKKLRRGLQNMQHLPTTVGDMGKYDEKGPSFR